MRGAARETPTRTGHSCWWPASSTRTTSCCSRRGSSAAPFDRRRWTHRNVPPAPTADEDLSTKPAAQIAFREAYYSGYGVAPAIDRTYTRNAQRYRDLYYRLHAEVDGPIDRVRRAVTEGGSKDAVLVRTADHGDLLGAHGGLHQKWFNLYDEATRVPFVVARIGSLATSARTVTAPTSHVDIVPTLLGAAGVDVGAVAATLAETFSEVHELPGRDLMPVVDGAAADEARAVGRATCGSWCARSTIRRRGPSRGSVILRRTGAAVRRIGASRSTTSGSCTT